MQESRVSATGNPSGAQQISVPFTFNVSDQVLPLYGSKISTFDTPPSTCVSYSGDVDSDPIEYAHCYIPYRIRSQVIQDGHVVGEIVQPFKLYMISGIQPPLCPDDFPGEYRLFDQRTFSFFHIKRHCHVTVETQEPHPIFMTNAHPSTTINVHLK